ncbi:MAG: hypothetical protein L7G96_02300 [Vulcanisaeta sp.]|nr:hypothetical protein [Vulcanisaeta sp.]MCG2895294.1 hypothetical protein [Vulcanisaeta sp.]
MRECTKLKHAINAIRKARDRIIVMAPTLNDTLTIHIINAYRRGVNITVITRPGNTKVIGPPLILYLFFAELTVSMVAFMITMSTLFYHATVNPALSGMVWSPIMPAFMFAIIFFSSILYIGNTETQHTIALNMLRNPRQHLRTSRIAVLGSSLTLIAGGVVYGYIGHTLIEGATPVVLLTQGLAYAIATLLLALLIYDLTRGFRPGNITIKYRDYVKSTVIIVDNKGWTCTEEISPNDAITLIRDFLKEDL